MKRPDGTITLTESLVREYTNEFLEHCGKLNGNETHREFMSTSGWKYVLKCLESVERGDTEEVDTGQLNNLKAFCHIPSKYEVFERVVELVERLRTGEADEMALFGLPVSLKDNVALRGAVLTNGTPYRHYKPEFDATCTAKLMKSGVVVVGKTKLNGYGLGTNTPEVLNPFGEEYIVGGSSGGPAASVGGNSVTCALGTDTGGSVRLPAAFCGCVGYRPSFGAISRFGVCELGATMDTVGFITNTVYQNAYLAYLTVGYDVKDMYSKHEANQLKERIHMLLENIDNNKLVIHGKPFEGITVGMFDNEEIYKLGYIDEENKANMENVERTLKSMGAKVKRLQKVPFETYTAVYYLYTAKQVATNLRKYNKHKFTLSNSHSMLNLLNNLDRRIKERHLLGELVKMSCFEIEKLLRDEREKLVKWVEENGLFGEVEFLVTPTGSKVLPNRSIEYDSKNMYLLDMFLTISPILGVCALTLPLRSGERPHCLHITGGYLQDHRLFEVAYTIEQSLRRMNGDAG